MAAPVFIEDNFTLNVNSFHVPEYYRDMCESIIITHGTIVDRVEKLAFDIAEQHKGQTLHILCVLKGASAFFEDLCSSLKNFGTIPFTFDFIKVKSYSGMASTGDVTITGCDLNDLNGRHVLIVEDIIDTGLTITRLLAHLAASTTTASTRVASLLEKRTPHSNGFKADYIGFSIPDKFIVGYGLDYNEAYRDFKHIGVISRDGISRFKNFPHSLSQACIEEVDD